MRYLVLPFVVIAGISTTTAQADTWTWTPISNGGTLDAHLARCNFARPNPMVVFSTIAEVQDKMVAPQQKVGLAALIAE